MKLFEDNGAEFSPCKKYRFRLWRIWDVQKPLVMFIGLNPSKADSDTDDNTIKRVTAISRHNGYGGFYMLNCFPYISTDPNLLTEHGNTTYNDQMLRICGKVVQDVVFAWGNFKIVKRLGRDLELKKMFPQAKALFINKNGSPKHPLFCRIETALIDFIPNLPF